MAEADRSGLQLSLNDSVFDELAGVIYRDTADGTLRSTDMGASWTRTGPRPLVGFTNDLAISPVDRALLAEARRVVERLGSVREPRLHLFGRREDAADLGFATTVLWDLTRAVDPAHDAAVSTALRDKRVVIGESASLR